MRIFLVRHGESQANVNQELNKVIPDHDIALTEEGQDQALEAGKFLKQYLEKYPAKMSYGNQVAAQLMPQVMGGLTNLFKEAGLDNSPQMKAFKDNQNSLLKPRLWNSPYRRARETARVIHGQTFNFIRDTREDVLLCEQQFGLFDGLSDEEALKEFKAEAECFEKQKKAHGKFWARYPQGESGFDVSCRLRQFFGTIKRDEQDKQISDVIIVCHGTVSRLFTQMWLHKPWEWFSDEPNPGNCSIRLIEGNKDGGYIFGGYRDGKEWKHTVNKYDK